MVPVCSLVIFVSSRARRPVVLELLQPLLDRADGPLVRVRVTVPLDQFPLVAAPHAHPRGVVVVCPPAARERSDAQRELAVGRRFDAAGGDPCAREDGRKAAPRDRELAVARVSAQRVAAVADSELAVARRRRRWTQGGGGGARGRRRARLDRGGRRTLVRLGGGAVVTANLGGGAVVIIANNLGARAVVIANLGGGAVVIIANNLGAGAVVIANLGGGSRGDRLGDACGWRRDERHAIAVANRGCVVAMVQYVFPLIGAVLYVVLLALASALAPPTTRP